jgi:hypothetical protein
MNTPIDPAKLAEYQKIIQSDQQLKDILMDQIQHILENVTDSESDGTDDCEDCEDYDCYENDCDCYCHESFQGYIEESRLRISSYIFNKFIPNHIIPKVAPNENQP